MSDDNFKSAKDGGISRREFVGMAVAASVAASAEKLGLGRGLQKQG